MRMLLSRLKQFIFISLLATGFFFSGYAIATSSDELTIDRAQVVTQQINLLKGRYAQLKSELNELQSRHDEQLSSLVVEKASKSLLDKASLDISVSKSNLDSITIELTDSEQTLNWLEKNIQEIDNQLNVMNIFGLKVSRNEYGSLEGLHEDLKYQQKLLALEQVRSGYLRDLKTAAYSILQLKNEHLAKLKAVLKSRQLVYVKQKQIKDELAYQEDQNYWLQQLNTLYARLGRLDPAGSRKEYTTIERGIFYANEKASYAYAQSLIARYKDQIQQMKLVITRGNSISLLNEINEQVQTLYKQTRRLEGVIHSRSVILQKHVNYLSPKIDNNPDIGVYTDNLKQLIVQYQTANLSLEKVDKSLLDFRSTLDRALQVELSSRQGLPVFGLKSLLDIGKEMLLVVPLTFQILKSLSVHLLRGISTTSGLAWALFGIIQGFVVFAFFFLRNVLRHYAVNQSIQSHERISAKWLSLQFIQRNFLDIVVISNLLSALYFFAVPVQNFAFIMYLGIVWLAFKAIITVARLWLVESTHDSAGHDVKLYLRLRWIFLAAAFITALTVFMHQLPLIYELKILCDRLFLLSLMLVSILLLKSWDVVPNMILSHMESQHPYFEKSIRLIGILVPLLLFGNSLMGLIGYVNLVMTVTWYEGLFLLVLIGYLVLRGLLSDAMMQLSGLMIRYASNGWLWTEAFLKPLDKVLRIALLVSAWATLFLLYGWDKQSPIVERLTRMLHYQLISVLNTTITPVNIIELFVVISVFYWTAKWTREFVYRGLSRRTDDMGIRNSIAILSQYSVVIVGIFICMQVLGIDLRALVAVAGLFAFGIGLGLRDLANNFACGFLILLERPLRVGDIVSINNVDGEVTNIGSRAVTVKTWDMMDLLVPNTEIFNKSFTNWTAHDNTVRTTVQIKTGRLDNPHEVKVIILNVLLANPHVLNEPAPEVYLKEMSDALMEYELRFFINIRQVKSRTAVKSYILMAIWDEFMRHGIKPAYPQQEIFIRNSDAATPLMPSLEEQLQKSN